MTKKSAGYSETALKKMLKAYHCPLGFHEVRMRFVGHLIAPEPGVSPLEAIQGLWDGKLPEVDHVDDLNHIFELLMAGLWNELAGQVRMRREKVRLSPPPAGKGFKALGRGALFRAQELQRFEEGLLGDADFVDIPQPAAQGMRTLGDMIGLFASVHNTIKSGMPGTDEDVKALLANMTDLTNIAETELNTVIDAWLAHLPDKDNSTLH